MRTCNEQRLRFYDVQIIVPTFVYSCTKQRIIIKVKENLLFKHILSLTVNMSNGQKI